MEYDVVISIDGFENEKKFILEKIDDFFSVIRGVETESELRLMSFGALKSLKFELPEEFTEKLEIQTIDDISIYYIFVLQTANNDNSLNTFSPVILNNKTKKWGKSI